MDSGKTKIIYHLSIFLCWVGFTGKKKIGDFSVNYELFIPRAFFFPARLNRLAFEVMGGLSLTLFLVLKRKKFTNISMAIQYSPSIFLGISFHIAKNLFRPSHCVLLLRDIFPEWCVDLGILGQNSWSTIFLRKLALLQFRVADEIWCQSHQDKNFLTLSSVYSRHASKVLIQRNWINWSKYEDSGKDRREVKLRNVIDRSRYRYVCAYTGNVGPSQDIRQLIHSFGYLPEVQLIVVGFGEVACEISRQSALHDNVVFLPAIENSEALGLHRICDCNIVKLSPRHQTGNIPYKIFDYIDSGSKIFIWANKGNDCLSLEVYRGIATTCTDDVREAAEKLLALLEEGSTGVDRMHLYNWFGTSNLEQRLNRFVRGV